MINYLKRYKNQIINFLIKKAYSYFFLNDFKSTGYYAHLKNLIFEFLQSKYPNYKKELFEKRIKSLILNYNEYRDLNNALNNLFNPNYNDNLQDHYKNIEKNIFFKFILNSLNTKLIKNKYSEIYNFSINEINEPLNILEIGGGLPHGFIYNIWRKEKLFFKNFNYIDADLLHTEFVKWYCHKLKIPSEIEILLDVATLYSSSTAPLTRIILVRRVGKKRRFKTSPARNSLSNPNTRACERPSASK